jgi:hypothetical protein
MLESNWRLCDLSRVSFQTGKGGLDCLLENPCSNLYMISYFYQKDIVFKDWSPLPSFYLAVWLPQKGNPALKSVVRTYFLSCDKRVGG